MQEFELLIQAGLSPKEAEIYQILLESGQVPANKILPLTKLKRTTVYSVLLELEKKGLIEKDESRGLAEFRTKHPFALKEYLDNQANRIQKTNAKLDFVLPNFINLYSKTQNKPGVRYLEGVEGFKKIYHDILETQSDICVFSSPADKTTPAMEKIINDNILKQKKQNIRTRALVRDVSISSKQIIQNLSKNLIEIHMIPNESLGMPSQILIYGNKVAITSLKNEIFSTLIENNNISLSLKMIFEYIWQASENEHQKIYNTLPDS